jgi:hypothetical protein
MKQIKFLVLSILFLSLSSCVQNLESVQNGSQISEKDKSIKIQNKWRLLDEDIYSIEYPDDWVVDKSRDSGTRFFLSSPPSSTQDKFRENVNLIIQDLKGQNINLDKYVAITEEQIKTLLTNGNILKSTRMNSNVISSHQFIYTGKIGDFNFKFLQYIWILGEKAFVLTLTCEANEFDKYRETGEKILNSFKMK